MLSNGVHLFCLLVIQVLDSCCSASIEQGEDLVLPHPLASNVFYDNIASGELNASRPLTFHVHYRPVASNFTPTQRRKLVEARRLFLRSTSTYNKDDTVAPTSHDVFVDVDLYGKFTSLGYYYTYLHVGDPEQFFTVIMDTGSVVTAIPCEGCKDCGKHSGGHKVPHNHGTETGVFVVKKSTSALVVGTKFSQSYTEGSSLSGYYVEDTLCLGQDCDLSHEGIRFKFGCATKMTNLFRTQLADGIMGMANHGSTVLNAMRGKFHKDIYTLCLSPNNGYFTIGGYETVRHYTPVVWNSNYQATKNKYYHIQITGIKVDGTDTGVKKDMLRYSSGGALVDSGTTYTYIPRTAHSKLVTAYKTFCSVDKTSRCKGKTVTYDKTSVACYNQLSMSEKQTHPDLQFETPGGTLCIPPEQYFFEERGKSCVGFLRDTSSFVLGGNFMINYDVIFDREKGKVGMARASCQSSSTPPPCCGSDCSTTGGQVADAIDDIADHTDFNESVASLAANILINSGAASASSGTVDLRAVDALTLEY